MNSNRLLTGCPLFNIEENVLHSRSGGFTGINTGLPSFENSKKSKISLKVATV